MSGKPIAEDDLHAYVDGLLDEARRAEVAAYFEAHPEVAARFARYSEHRADIRAALDPVAEEPVPTRLNLMHVVAARRANRSPIWRSAAAAIVLFVIGGSGGWALHGALQPPSEGVAALAREATDSFVTYASDIVRPVELRSDNAAELVEWATQRMGRRPVLPDLSRSGYRMMGGRIVSTPHGAGLMLMYDNDRGRRLVMLSRPMKVDQNRRMTPHSAGNVAGWSWATQGMGYSIVGALPSDELHPLADDIRQQVLVRA
jgi:anti-sigma factor RsiW